MRYDQNLTKYLKKKHNGANWQNLKKYLWREKNVDYKSWKLLYAMKCSPRSLSLIALRALLRSASASSFSISTSSGLFATLILEIVCRIIIKIDLKLRIQYLYQML